MTTPDPSGDALKAGIVRIEQRGASDDILVKHDEAGCWLHQGNDDILIRPGYLPKVLAVISPPPVSLDEVAEVLERLQPWSDMIPTSEALRDAAALLTRIKERQ
jgi:hypothetical protein